MPRGEQHMAAFAHINENIAKWTDSDAFSDDHYLATDFLFVYSACV